MSTTIPVASLVTDVRPRLHYPDDPPSVMASPEDATLTVIRELLNVSGARARGNAATCQIDLEARPLTEELTRRRLLGWPAYRRQGGSSRRFRLTVPSQPAFDGRRYALRLPVQVPPGWASRQPQHLAGVAGGALWRRK
jgi:hypothetical protein